MRQLLGREGGNEYIMLAVARWGLYFAFKFRHRGPYHRIKLGRLR